MSKSEKPLDPKTRNALTEMGFSRQFIDMAIQDTGSTQIESLIDAIYTNENRYNKVVKKEGKKPSNPFEALSDEVVQLKFGEKPELSRAKSDSRKAQNKEDSNIESNTLVEIYKFISSLNSEASGKEPNVIINRVSELLKSLKFTNPAGKEILKHMNYDSNCSQISDLRNKVFETIQKVMNMRVKRGVTIDINEVDYILLMSFEMKLLKVNQMDLLMTGFIKFCSKMGFKPDEILMKSLDKLIMEATKMNASNNVLNPTDRTVEEDRKLLEDPVILKCLNIKNTDIQLHEETKSEADVHFKPRVEKEFCIICMDKIREVVFLPCCHFLTCPDCSSRTGTCPLCAKKVDKNLKIYWS
jgi:E3 ubiquitin-protein ligase XIAP/baculoviral IAP repeat-containing protein 2/3